MLIRNYVGISCTGHDNSLAIVNSKGEIVFAEAAERYAKNKHALNIPADDQTRILDLIEQFGDPGAEIVITKSWSDQSEAKWLAERDLFNQRLLELDGEKDQDWIGRVFFHMVAWEKCVKPNMMLAGLSTEMYCWAKARNYQTRSYDHHLTHAAFACFTSPFDEAVCAVVDAQGEASSTAFYRYANGKITPIENLPSVNNLYGSMASLGFYYGLTICALCDLPVLNGEEWKIMGLAPYGKLNDELYAILKRHIYIEGVNIVLGSETAAALREMQKFAKQPSQSYEDIADLAFTAQFYFGEMLGTMLTNLHQIFPSDNLVLTGGCALNSSFNRLLTKTTPFKNVYIPSAPSDDGNAAGAALLAFYEDNPQTISKPMAFQSPYLGSSMDYDTLAAVIHNGGLGGKVNLAGEDIYKYVAHEIANGKVIAWIQGRAEFGPRALGNRSILADPRRADMKDKINAVVKFRESYRPFAPSILHEYGAQYFEDYVETPYMERALRFREEYRHRVPAVCHKDNTGRLQSVKKENNKPFYDLISAFHEITGVPMLLNTSLNIMGKPMVHDVSDAITIYLISGIDILVIGDHVYSKADRLASSKPIDQLAISVAR